jgi:hypothetical protein
LEGRKKMRYTLTLILVLTLSLLLALPLAAQEKKKTETAKPDAPRVARAVAGALQLRRDLYNPDGFQVDYAYLTGTTFVCYAYRHLNQFGGFDRGAAVFVIIEENMRKPPRLPFDKPVDLGDGVIGTLRDSVVDENGRCAYSRGDGKDPVHFLEPDPGGDVTEAVRDALNPLAPAQHTPNSAGEETAACVRRIAQQMGLTESEVLAALREAALKRKPE